MGKFDKVKAKIDEIIKVTEDGNYIYRGIDIASFPVESSLYRTHKKLISSSYDLSMIEKEKLEIYKKDLFSAYTSDVEVLTEIQHFGGNTSLIDFSMSLFIALFFAAQTKPNHDGKIFFINIKDLYAIGLKDDLYANTEKQEKNYVLINPLASNNRVLFQRSVFVHAPEGTIREEDVNKRGEKILKSIIIEHSLKRKILEYLNLFCDINYNTVYHDLHGYIKNEENINSPVQILLKAYRDKGESNYINAIKKYTIYLNQNKSTTDDQKNKKIYYDRGCCYFKLFKLNNAFSDFIEAGSMEEALYVQIHLQMMWQKKYDLALQSLDRIHQNQNNSLFDDIDVIYLKALLFQKKGDYITAKKIYENLLLTIGDKKSKDFKYDKSEVLKQIKNLNQKIEISQ